ncbi:DUF465 domain-containing protein [Pseudomonas sp. KNUC1026]|uniref:DUF465 domain-containing protein n=1 Tax=Pseudomonas sp. KNUC1026 TaxID=2893890 RepID=UPI002E306E85|nr:DUF465 domain-containing protein [Pseudomonas sp. KNUC1026]
MPVKHDLFEDLGVSKESVVQRSGDDPVLARLLSDYQDIDGQVVEAEEQAAADDVVRKLKEKRLLVKDRISQQLDYPGSRGAAKTSDPLRRRGCWPRHLPCSIPLPCTFTPDGRHAPACFPLRKFYFKRRGQPSAIPL